MPAARRQLPPQLPTSRFCALLSKLVMWDTIRYPSACLLVASGKERMASC